MTNVDEGKVEIGDFLITPDSTEDKLSGLFEEGGLLHKNELVEIDNVLFRISVSFYNNGLIDYLWLEPMLDEDDIKREATPFGDRMDKKYAILKEWLKDKNYLGGLERGWGKARIDYVSLEPPNPRWYECNVCKLRLSYKQGKETPKLRKEEDGLLEFILHLIQNSGTVYFVTSNGMFGKKTVEMNINLFNEEKLGDNVVLVGSNANNPFKKDSIRQGLDKIKLPKIKYYKVDNIKLLYRILLYCKTRGVKSVVTVSENSGSIDIDKAIYTIEYLAEKFIN